MAVVNCFKNEEGNLLGEVRWSAAPGATFRLELERDGRLVEWRARADNGASISARQLRAAPIGAMERALRRHASELANRLDEAASTPQADTGKVPHGPDRALILELAAWANDFAERPRTGPAGRSDQSYASLAALYLKTIDDGEEHPVRAVAARLGMAEKTVQNHLYKARERGLLTSRGRGRAGGQLTDKAKEILHGDHQAP